VDEKEKADKVWSMCVDQPQVPSTRNCNSNIDFYLLS